MKGGAIVINSLRYGDISADRAFIIFEQNSTKLNETFTKSMKQKMYNKVTRHYNVYKHMYQNTILHSFCLQSFEKS